MELADFLRSNGLELIQANVASGGSSDIHKARVTADRDRFPPVGSFVAVKQYKPSILEISGQLARIKQEADVGSKLKHANVVQTYALLSQDDASATSPFLLVMEWVDGSTLQKWNEETFGSHTWVELRDVCRGILDGVAELHRVGVLHRDIKPENIMMRQDVIPVVMDVGVAEITGENTHTLHTLVKDFVGSIRYASPQFIRGEPFTEGDDIYSVGATFLELLTGKQFFGDIRRNAILAVYVMAGITELPPLRAGVPPPMQVLLHGCLNQNPKRRPTIAQIRDALDDPDRSDYISEELAKRNKEKEAWEIVQVLAGETGFFADVGDAKMEIDWRYKVVRRIGKMRVPSYGRDLVPEQWIADVVLKHVSVPLGHFVRLGRRWEPNIGTAAMIKSLSSEGEWVDYEKITSKIKVGDFVVRAS